MKPLYATFFAAALLVCAKPVFPADNALDVSELNCGQFMKYDDNNIIPAHHQGDRITPAAIGGTDRWPEGVEPHKIHLGGPSE